MLRIYQKSFCALSLLSLCLLLLIPPKVKASHLMGADISYECLNNCTVRVHLRAYRDCTGSSTINITPQFVPQFFGCGPLNPVQSDWPPEIVQEVTPVCNSVTTSCGGGTGTVNGVEEYYWFRDYEICAYPNCIYTIEWESCCRNPSISSGAAGEGMFLGSTTLNTGITPCNNSPYFTVLPVPYICRGQPFVFNQGAVDPDGDSLIYTLGTCYDESIATPVPYNSGYSPSQPLGTSWDVSINQTTGDITLVPQPGSADKVASVHPRVETDTLASGKPWITLMVNVY